MNLNYFNFKKFNGKYLLINDFGEYSFLTSDEFNSLINNNNCLEKDKINELVQKGFLYEGSKWDFIQNFYSKYRNAKSYTLTPTSLHIFVVTNECNMNCIYCQAGCPDHQSKHLFMDYETARKAASLALASPSAAITVEFQGGEPLLNFPIIQYVYHYLEKNRGQKHIEYTIVSNLTVATDEILQWLADHQFNLSTSIDGPEFVHNYNRPLISGKGTYSIMQERLRKARSFGIKPGGIQTTTRKSLSHPKEIVDAHLQNGLDNVFIRPLTPLGVANKNWNTIGYSADEFVKFYSQILEYILEINLSGTYCKEGHASIFLAKILNQNPINYMELRSPCGAGTGQICYYCNGQIFTCDEGRMAYEMGDDSFLLGTVDVSTFSELISHPVCQTVVKSSILEALPECCNCVYQPYCGTCPVINHSLYDDIIPNQPNDYRCQIYKGMLDTIFKYLELNDPNIISIFRSWT